jgi:hypothetical protein
VFIGFFVEQAIFTVEFRAAEWTWKVAWKGYGFGSLSFQVFLGNTIGNSTQRTITPEIPNIKQGRAHASFHSSLYTCIGPVEPRVKPIIAKETQKERNAKGNDTKTMSPISVIIFPLTSSGSSFFRLLFLFFMGLS